MVARLYEVCPFLVQPQGMVLRISSDRDDQIGAKMKTQKSWGFQRKPKKKNSPAPNSNSKITLCRNRCTAVQHHCEVLKQP